MKRLFYFFLLSMPHLYKWLLLHNHSVIQAKPLSLSLMYFKFSLHFLSGFIHKKLLKTEACLSCCEYLKNCTIRSSSKFIDFVNRGLLFKPNSSLNLIVKIADSCFKIECNVGNILQQKNLLQKICLQVMRILDERHPKIFSQLDTHIDHNNLQNAKSHKSLMIQKIVTSFLSIRFKHYCKEFNQNVLDKRFRRVALKTVHFQGQ